MLRLPGQVSAALHFHARHHDRFITGPPINVNSDNDGQLGQLTVCEHVLVRARAALDAEHDRRAASADICILGHRVGMTQTFAA
jgi:hypothetical protein